MVAKSSDEVTGDGSKRFMPIAILKQVNAQLHLRIIWLGAEHQRPKNPHLLPILQKMVRDQTVKKFTHLIFVQKIGQI